MRNPFRRNNDRNELGQSMAAGMAASENARPQSSQDALDQSLGVNPLLLADEEALGMVRSMSFRLGKDGNIEYVDPRFAAVSLLTTYTPSTSKYDQIDAEIMLRKTACVMRTVLMNCSDAEYESGIAAVAEATYTCIVYPNIMGGIGGFKGKLIKSSPKSMEVTYREGKDNRKAGEMGP